MSPLGAIAQLEERLHGMQEVVGSSPTSSIRTVVCDGYRSIKSLIPRGDAHRPPSGVSHDLAHFNAKREPNTIATAGTAINAWFVRSQFGSFG
jgi:hypothetical protein